MATRRAERHHLTDRNRAALPALVVTWIGTVPASAWEGQPADLAAELKLLADHVPDV